MLQVIMLVVGAYYLIRLLRLGSAEAGLELDPDSLDRWRSARRRQFAWGIVAGWGSLILYILYIAYVSRCATTHCTLDEAAGAALGGVILSLIVMIVGVVLSETSRRAANLVQSTGGSTTWGEISDDSTGQSDWGGPKTHADQAAASDASAAIPPADTSTDRA